MVPVVGEGGIFVDASTNLHGVQALAGELLPGVRGQQWGNLLLSRYCCCQEEEEGEGRVEEGHLQV